MSDILLVLFGILGGGVVTLFAARHYAFHRPRLRFSLVPAAILRRSDFGRTFRMTANGADLNNLWVFNLELNLQGRSDISRTQIPEDNKPTLFFPNFVIHDVRTIGYDQTRFNIPLAVAAAGAMLIVNLDRMRARTTARFQIIGSFRDDQIDPGDFQASFYPGSIHNVDVETTGCIRRPWKRTRDERQD